jgi:DNA-binding NtrC family response regulator
LVAYEWPGNVRELRNVAERLVVQDHDGEIMPADLPPDIVASGAGQRVTSAPRRRAEGPVLTVPSPHIAELLEALLSGRMRTRYGLFMERNVTPMVDWKKLN